MIDMVMNVDAKSLAIEDGKFSIDLFRMMKYDWLHKMFVETRTKVIELVWRAIDGHLKVEQLVSSFNQIKVSFEWTFYAQAELKWLKQLLTLKVSC